MDKRKGDWLIITFVLIILCSVGYMIFTDRLNIEPPKDQCWYEIKYLHVSGREITKRVYMTCDGFKSRYFWMKNNKKYSVTIVFSDHNDVTIQGATDILSVEKIKENE